MIRDIFQQPWFSSHCYFTHPLGLKMIRNIPQLAWVYFNNFNAHPLSFKTVRNIHNGQALMSTASSCTPGAPGIYFSMCNALVHVPSIVLSMIYKNAYTSHSFLFKSLGQVRVKVQRTNLYEEGSSFWVHKNPFNHFHNPHFQALVHRQDLSCALYAQPLKQAQEPYQTYTLKDNLS